LDAEREFGVETISMAADPKFVHVETGDFSFQPDSPAAELGIVALDSAIAGLQPPYEQRMIGRRIRTQISPVGQILKKPVTVTIESGYGGAEIRYTLDRSEPTQRSLLYTEPFVLEKPCIVRARAFAEGATDLFGAYVEFGAPQPPIMEDFESAAVGDTAPGAHTTEENEQYRARVTEEQAASGRRSLKFIDGPNQEKPYNPHVFYRTKFTEGRMIGRFNIRIDENTRFYCQWRDYRRGYTRGPTVQIMEGGKLVHRDDEVATLPFGQWIGFEVACVLGERATGKYDMKVFLPGEKEPRTFSDLPYDEDFREVDWLGFVPNGTKDTVFYVDNIELRPDM